MTNDTNVTIRFNEAKADLDRLKRILTEMDNYKTTASTKDEAINQWKEELCRRLVTAGLSK
ncbi:MAG: hypothetical protein ACFFER_08710 [Candidatus Thorarchaeota archaeon]